MRILVVNSGSSSIKFSMFDSGSAAGSAEPSVVYDGELRDIGETEAKVELRGPDGADFSLAGANPGGGRAAATSAEAIRMILEVVSGPHMPAVQAVGYRVVHPGEKLEGHQRITDEVLKDLEDAVVFAPLHDPAVIDVIREGMARFPEVPHYACFDTVFHRTMPEEATTYAVPAVYREQGVRRYGFHGLSCESIVRRIRAEGVAVPKRMVIAHLGSGCSVTALVDGCSVDTSMGLTPTGGVVMGTRPGDLDPGVVLYMLRKQQGDATARVEHALNHDSGMVALTGLANDMKEVRRAASQENEKAVLALKVFTRSVTKTVGGFCWLMGGLDAMVFTGGIGEHDALTRTEVFAGLEGLGVSVDPSRNTAKATGVWQISADNSAIKVFVIAAQEDLMIAVHVDRMVRLGK
jgi:acetate kinase